MKCGAAGLWIILLILIASYIIVKKPLEEFATEATPTRPCAVYFTRNPEACDDPRGLFGMSMPALAAARDAATDPAEKNKFADLYNERNENPWLPVCKVVFKDLVEPADSPYKSAVISEERGPAEHWAYCYNQTPVSTAEAESAKVTFGNKGALEADTVLPDNSVRVTFKALDYPSIRETYCYMNPPQNNGVTLNNVLVINTRTGDQTKIEGVQVTDIAGGQINTSPGANQVFLKLFERRRVGNQLVLAPRQNITGKLMVLYNDICGSIFKKSETPVTFTISGASTVLASSIPPWVERDLIGQYGTMVNTLATKRRDLTAAATDTTNTAQGLVRVQYNWSHLSNWQPLNNKTDVDNLIARAVFTSREIDRTIYYMSSDVPHYYIRVWEGYLNITTADTYDFRISTDDSGELFLNNILVASHYGYHGADAGGATIDARSYSRGLVPLKLRLVEQWGGHGINYIQWRRRGDYTWRNIPVANFVYSTNIYNRDQLQLEINDLQEKITALEPYYQIMTGDSSTLLTKLWTAVTNLRGKNVPTALSPANISFQSLYFLVLDGVDTSLRVNPEWDQTDRQDIITTPAINIAKSSRLFTDLPVIDYSKTQLTYTVAFWLWIDSGRRSWRNVLILGENWGSGGGDRNPGIFIYPDMTTRIHFRQSSTRDYNDGVDIYSNYPAFKTWFHFAAVVNNNTIQLYINGVPRESMRLPGSHTFLWSPVTARKKKLYINSYRQKGEVNDDGEMYLARLMWANRAFTTSEVADLSREFI